MVYQQNKHELNVIETEFESPSSISTKFALQIVHVIMKNGKQKSHKARALFLEVAKLSSPHKRTLQKNFC